MLTNFVGAGAFHQLQYTLSCSLGDRKWTHTSVVKLNARQKGYWAESRLIFASRGGRGNALIEDKSSS